MTIRHRIMATAGATLIAGGMVVALSSPSGAWTHCDSPNPSEREADCDTTTVKQPESVPEHPTTTGHTSSSAATTVVVTTVPTTAATTAPPTTVPTSPPTTVCEDNPASPRHLPVGTPCETTTVPTTAPATTVPPSTVPTSDAATTAPAATEATMPRAPRAPASPPTSVVTAFPVTGSNTGLLVWVGLGGVAAGLVLLALSRRPRVV